MGCLFDVAEVQPSLRVQGAGSCKANPGAAQTLNNMYHRWTSEMETDFLKQHHWRKSSQWVTLRCVLQL